MNANIQLWYVQVWIHFVVHGCVQLTFLPLHSTKYQVLTVLSVLTCVYEHMCTCVHTHTELPNSANKNTGLPVKFEF